LRWRIGPPNTNDRPKTKILVDGGDPEKKLHIKKLLGCHVPSKMRI